MFTSTRFPALVTSLVVLCPAFVMAAGSPYGRSRMEVNIQGNQPQNYNSGSSVYRTPATALAAPSATNGTRSFSYEPSPNVNQPAAPANNGTRRYSYEPTVNANQGNQVPPASGCQCGPVTIAPAAPSAAPTAPSNVTSDNRAFSYEPTPSNAMAAPVQRSYSVQPRSNWSGRSSGNSGEFLGSAKGNAPFNKR